ncbi:MAG: GvpL/GvpF family gas vesicle protein [Chloroflexi bacterium]|nr:GvpL/GvpF family gas vesicle protein [Chloroflexota bacterium]
MAQLRKYLYCIIPCQQEITFDAKGISDEGSAVHTVCYENLAAVVSDSHTDKYETTRKHMIAHETVLEKVMQGFTLLPVRFGTVTGPDEPAQDIRLLLQERYQEFTDLLNEMDGKSELGLKAFWRDEKAVYAEILAENADIRRLSNSLSRLPAEAARFEGIALGRRVREALDDKREQEAARILAPLRRLAARVRVNDVLLDRMILNVAFLVEKAKGPLFDQAVSELDKRYGERVALKYVGPVPSYNFVNIVVNWPGAK